jgi:hypothetical protein
MDWLAPVLSWLNVPANALSRWVLAPIALMPGWVSATLVAVVTGVLLLVVFKYTSNQRAIKQVRADIKAHLLALKLFKENPRVVVRAQGRVLAGAGRLLVLAIVPMLVMLVPVLLVLGQLSLWYQYRALTVGEEAVVTLKLKSDGESSWPAVRMQPTDTIETLVGPVRILSKHEICWDIKACRSGYHHLSFDVDRQTADKELAIGDGFMRVSALRPGQRWLDVLEHPLETPFTADAPVKSIAIDYPSRSSWTSGKDLWVVYWFVASMIAGLCFRRAFNVQI